MKIPRKLNLTLLCSLFFFSGIISAQDDDIIEAGDQQNQVVSQPNNPGEETGETGEKSAEKTSGKTEDEEGVIIPGQTGQKKEGTTVSEAVGGLSFSGYIDMGFFHAQNNGVGFIKDVYNTSGYADQAAGTFLGDYASTMINSRNESADQGPAQFFMEDPVQSGGNPSFILNELYLNMAADLNEKARAQAAISFAPRKKNLNNDGNITELDLAFIDYKPFSGLDMTLTAGKFVGITGIEYRWRNAPDRWTVTPSLLSRYTDGTPVGMKVRTKLFDKRFITNFGVTNGSNFIRSTRQEDRIESNSLKTFSSRVSYDFYFDPFSLLEIGLSGEWGAQSNQISNDPKQQVAGADFQMALYGLELRGQFLWLKLDGGAVNEAKHYEGFGSYAEALYGWSGFLGAVDRFAVYTRVGQRKVNEIDDKYIFIVDVFDVIPGIRIDITHNMIFKMEYVFNFEHGKVPNFNNDVFTTSLIAKF